MSRNKKILEFMLITITAFLSSLNYAVFVFPNSFAPAGLDGICTIIQDITKVNIGYFSFLANIPLLLAAYFFLEREFAVKTTLYVLVFSVSSIFLKYIDISVLMYHTATGTSIVLAPVAAGTIRGILYAITLKQKGSSGGMDIVAALIKKKKPHLNLMSLIFIINLIIALSSYFVYGLKVEPVICSIIYSFITSNVSNYFQFDMNKMIKYEIITPQADKMCKEITNSLHTSATVIDAQGAYSGENKNMVLCVVYKH